MSLRASSSSPLVELVAGHVGDGTYVANTSSGLLTISFDAEREQYGATLGDSEIGFTALDLFGFGGAWNESGTEIVALGLVPSMTVAAPYQAKLASFGLAFGVFLDCLALLVAPVGRFFLVSTGRTRNSDALSL